MNDEQILQIAKRTLNQGLTRAKITQCTDAELLNFARAVMKASPEMKRYRWLLEQDWEYQKLGVAGVEQAIDSAMRESLADELPVWAIVSETKEHP